MSSIIKIRRTLGNNKPPTINWGELSYVTGIGSYGGVNQYKDRIFIGDYSGNSIPIGGHYYTSMMEHQPGAIAGVVNDRNYDGGIVVILDKNRKVDQWNVDDITIDSNKISTNNGATELYIDPYPSGLSNEGTVIIKGNLQVDGNTTSINSVSLDLNDPIIIVGDVTSTRTVMSPVSVGVNTIRLDSVVGINTNDIISGSSYLSLSGISTILSFDVINKIITIQDYVLSPGISSTTQLTITHGFNTHTDRGIGFNYNTSSGVENNKTGFFGYIDGTNVGSSATARSWTYIPDASINGNVVTGTRGFLDIKGIYYQTGDYNTHGIVYFDENGLQTSTNNPNNSISASKQVLTSVSKVVLTIPSEITVSSGDFIIQESTNAYGIVETSGTTSSLNLIAVEGIFNNSSNIRRESSGGLVQNFSFSPSSVSSIYNNKPHWTSTLDGGAF